MMFKSLGAVAVLLMTTSLAQAAFDADSVATQLQSEGYTRIEIKIGQAIAKVEAIKGTTKLEVTYDIASGDVIKTETEAVRAGDNTAPGVQIRDEASDDRGGRGGDDDGPNHDVNDDHGGGDDDGPNHDAGDDHGGGNDDGPNHDANDDHGGHSGSGHGGDDDGDDDHGGRSGHGGGDDDSGHGRHGGDDD